MIGSIEERPFQGEGRELGYETERRKVALSRARTDSSIKGKFFLGGQLLHYFKEWMRGLHDLLVDKPSSLLMLGCSSIFTASLMILSMCLEFLARILHAI
jgi:hypothetical protein